MSKGRRPNAGSARRGADDPAIIDLLDTVREVRTTLAIDLSAAAGALEESRPEIAREILAATSAELEAAGAGLHAPATDQLAARRRSRRTRALLALPAVPLVGALAMTTAAALSGSHHTVAAHRVVTTTPVPARHSDASITLRRLEHVMLHHPQAAQVIAVADDLHKQLTAMIATSTNDPAQLHVVRRLLTLEQRVLESNKVPGTQFALAASRAIAELLDHHPSHPQTKHALSSHTRPSSAPTMRPKPTAAPTPTDAQRAPQQQQSAKTTHATPSPQPTNPLFGRGVFNHL